MPKLSVVIPVYNEEQNIDPFLERLIPVLHQLTNDCYEILFVLDPCKDRTEAIIMEQINQNERIKLIVLSRRFGQPAATMAGILTCEGNHCVVIDVDLQDPPELIPVMYERSREGFEVVYAKRRSRKGETLIKRFVSHVGYSLINKVSDVEIPRNTGDFRIISRRVIEEIRKLNETHGFLRGIVAYVGFSQTFVEYDRDERYAGKGNYNRFFGSLKIGINGIVSFSSKPLTLMSIVGAGVSMLSFMLGMWYVAQKLFGIPLTPGLSTTVLLISFFAGIQLLSLGLIGEYIGRIYDEVKRRPLFIIDKKIKNDISKL